MDFELANADLFRHLWLLRHFRSTFITPNYAWGSNTEVLAAATCQISIYVPLNKESSIFHAFVIWRGCMAGL